MMRVKQDGAGGWRVVVEVNELDRGYLPLPIRASRDKKTQVPKRLHFGECENIWAHRVPARDVVFVLSDGIISQSRERSIMEVIINSIKMPLCVKKV